MNLIVWCALSVVVALTVSAAKILIRSVYKNTRCDLCYLSLLLPGKFMHFMFTV